jgi:hypothetical protein
MSMEQWWKNDYKEKQEKPRKQPAPVPFCPSQVVEAQIQSLHWVVIHLGLNLGFHNEQSEPGHESYAGTV